MPLTLCAILFIVWSRLLHHVMQGSTFGFAKLTDKMVKKYPSGGGALKMLIPVRVPIQVWRRMSLSLQGDHTVIHKIET